MLISDALCQFDLLTHQVPKLRWQSLTGDERME
jgi:hypothetical protein